MAVTLAELEASFIWEVDHRFGLFTFSSAEQHDFTSVITQVSGPNFILAVPYGCFNPDGLTAAAERGFSDTALGPHTAVDVRLKGANGRALNRKVSIHIIEVDGSLASRISVYDPLTCEGRDGALLCPFGRDLRTATLGWMSAVDG